MVQVAEILHIYIAISANGLAMPGAEALVAILLINYPGILHSVPDGLILKLQEISIRALFQYKDRLSS